MTNVFNVYEIKVYNLCVNYYLLYITINYYIYY